MDCQNDAHHVSLFHCVLPRKSPWNYLLKRFVPYIAKVLGSATSAWTSFLLAFERMTSDGKGGWERKSRKTSEK